MAKRKPAATTLGNTTTAASGRQWLGMAAALAAVTLSALAVVQSSHACRGLYARLQVLEADQWYLQEDYSRLLLEQSTWASHHRVEKVATGELHMQPPPIADYNVVSP